jgi:hypothetical protein
MAPHELQTLLDLRGQLRREIELAEGKKLFTLPAKRKLAAVQKEISRMNRNETKGNLFDAQLDLF